VSDIVAGLGQLSNNETASLKERRYNNSEPNEMFLIMQEIYS
jgi:hypothetical protein